MAPREVQDRATSSHRVRDTVLGAIPLGRERVRAEGAQLRLLVIEPGGVVPWHEHGRRPPIICIVEGEIAEHSSTCAVRIIHRVGEVALESRGLRHWWRNDTRWRVVLLLADILPPAENPNMM